MKKYLLITNCASFKSILKEIDEAQKLIQYYKAKNATNKDVEELKKTCERLEEKALSEYIDLYEKLDKLERVTLAKAIKTFFIVRRNVNFKTFVKLLLSRNYKSLEIMKLCILSGLHTNKLEKLILLYPKAMTFAYQMTGYKKPINSIDSILF
jgi:CRISPR/Cas system CSM-associated protein Csm3 (group 7 of RAMP superfamily)